MKKIVRVELKRAIFNKGFVSAILCGLVFILLHIGMDHVPALKRQAVFGTQGFQYPYTLYNRWIGMDFASFSATALYFVFPILTALPYLSSMFSDKKSSYLQQILIRTERNRFILARSLAVFSASFIVAFVILTADLLATSCFFPALQPEPMASQTSLSEASMGRTMFFTHPMVYTLLYILLDSFSLSLFNVMFVPLFRYMSFQAEALLLPEFLYIFFYVFGSSMKADPLIPVNWLQPMQPVFGVRLAPILVELGVVALVTVGLWIWEVSRNDLPI